MRPPRPALLLGALLAPALPLVVAAPASAATYVICVNRTDDDCVANAATIPLALQIASVDGQDSVIRVGPGTYTDGPYAFAPTDGFSLTVQGSNNGTGDNATVLQAAADAPGPYVEVTDATVRNLRVRISGTGSTAVAVGGPAAQLINVFVADTTAAPAEDATGIELTGGAVQGSTVDLERAEGNTGIHQPSGTARVSRSTTRASRDGVVVEAGSLSVDNSELELGTLGAAGLRNDSEQAVDARYLTVVGGAAGSVGVQGPVTLRNSIVRGPATSVASGVTYSSSDVTEPGEGAVDGGGNLDVDPLFIDAAGRDYSLRAGSPVVDQGSQAVLSGNDRADNPRFVDGDRNGSPLPDMGAYELNDTKAPVTTFTSGPTGLTRNRTPSFTWRSEDGATFQCRVDAGAWVACGTAAVTAPLADGPHTFAVQATDRVFNVEQPPATRSFTVDTVAPNATITKRPAKRFGKKRVKFRFAASEAGARFQCRLDDRAWKTCSAVYRFNVKVGRHKLQVRALDKAGNVDPTPAKYSYRRVKRR